MESEHEVRTTTVHNRYEISDSCCGLVETASSLKKAIALAEIHASQHGAELGNTITAIEVFDRMARRDCQNTWMVPVPNAQGKPHGR